MIPHFRYQGPPHVPNEEATEIEESVDNDKISLGDLLAPALLFGTTGVFVLLGYAAGTVLGIFPRDIVDENLVRQSQVYQQRADAEERASPERVAERSQLQDLIDTDGSGIISSQEYDRFREATGREIYFDSAVADDLSRMSPNEVKNATREYEKAR